MLMGRRNNLVAVSALGVCMLISALSWMYMRIPHYEIMLETGSDITGWLLSGYIIAEVTVVIIAGVLMDRLGPRNSLLIGMALFSGSSVGLCLSENVLMMVAFRVMQGCGGGFLFTTALGFIPGAFDNKRKRLDPHKVMTLAFSVGSLFGTAVGYYFTVDVGDWRILVAVNALVVLLAGTAAYRSLEDAPASYVRDVPGLVLTMATISSVMLYTQTVNVDFELVSYESLAFAEFCILMVVLLVWAERRAADPLIPHGITRTDVGLMSGMFLAGFCGLGMLQFITLFMMVSYGASLYEASRMLLCLIGGGAVTSLIGMELIYRHGIRPLLLTGSIVIAIGFMGAFILMPRGMTGVGFSLFVMGLGFGLIITEMLVSIQTMSRPEHEGAITGLLMSARFIGIILGMAVYKSVISGPLTSFIEGVEDETVNDVELWVFDHLSVYANELLAIFESTVRECCMVASAMVLSVLVVCWFLVGKEDVDPPGSSIPASPAGSDACLAPEGRGCERADDECIHEDAYHEGESQLRHQLDPREDEGSETYRQCYRCDDDCRLERGQKVRGGLPP